MVELNINLPENFLSEEVRCGYMVSSERKKIWAVELDLLWKFDTVCEKNNLKYCVAAGTLLGTVRHRGFIPWDDDIDIYMLRDDYDRFVQLNDEFESPYYLQTTYSEKNLFRRHAQLRNSNTTGCVRADCSRDINRGIFIDIFPLDGISPNVRKDTLQQKMNNLYFRVLNLYNTAMSPMTPTGINRKARKLLGRLIFTLIRKETLFQKYEQNLRKYSNNSALMWGNRTKIFECPKSRRPISDWLDLTVMPFEFLTVPVPSNYDEILRQQYGDYMKIPQDKNGSMHGELIISVEQPYKDFFAQENKV